VQTYEGTAARYRSRNNQQAIRRLAERLRDYTRDSSFKLDDDIVQVLTPRLVWGPAAAVIQRLQALSGFIGRKGRVEGSVRLALNFTA